MFIPRSHPKAGVILASIILIIPMLLGGSGANAAHLKAPATSPTFWGPNVRANSDDSHYGQHEPHLAISRTNPNVVVVVAKDYRHLDNKEVWIYVSQDGGQTWPIEKQLHMPGLPADVPNQSDPVVFARDDGRIYVFCLGYDESIGNGHGVFVTWSDDDGNTWRDAVAITHDETPGYLDDKDWPAIDNFPSSLYYHNIYMSWANGGILFKRSTDGGQTWSSYTNIAPGDTEYPYPVVAADGSVYVFYMDGWGYCADGWIRYVKSTDGGQTFGSPQAVAATSQPCSPIHGPEGYDQWRFFSIITAASDPNNGDNLWVAWTDDNRITFGQTDVLYVRSTNGGATWSGPARLSHDPANTGRDHITPVFAVGADSRLHAFWLDRRADTKNRFFHGYYTSSSDGGVTWEPDSQVSEKSFDLNVGFPPGSNNAAGDYWGLDTVGNIVMAAWNTTVFGEQDIFVASSLSTLTGQVSNADSHRPVGGATVSVDPNHSATTDPEGIYALGLKTGVYTATASAEGYFSRIITDVQVVSRTVILDFALEPVPVTLTGQVSDAHQHTPIAYAQVEAIPGPVVYTNPGGVYSMTVPSGVYTLTAAAEGYIPYSVQYVHAITGTVVVDFSLEPVIVPVTLTGKVSDAIFLRPIDGASVTVKDTTVKTGPSGVYTLTTQAGIYTVTASAPSYFTKVITDVQAISGTVVLDFSLQPTLCPIPDIRQVNIITDDLTATFSASISSTLEVTYTWNFGDGQTSTEPDPVHTYAAYGTYPISLAVENACGKSTWSGKVTLAAPPRRVYLSIVIK